jgi:Peptidase MA superfamily
VAVGAGLRSIVVAALIVGLLELGVPAAYAAGPAVTFGTPTATASYGTSIGFVQPVALGPPPRRVEVLLDFPGSDGPLVVDETDQASGGGSVDLRHTIDIADGHLLPNSVISARWRVLGSDGTTSVGPSVSVTYADDRFHWQTEAGSIVRIHWYQGDAAFGRRALAIAENGVAKAEQLLGVTETKPIDFFVYADQQAFYDALGPGTRENVGGEAVAEIRTLFGLITPSEVNASWVGIVIPHELTHLVFDTAVHNPYHFPPRWLNEGLAVYLSQGYVSSDRGDVEDAGRSGTLMPLTALIGQFPTTAERFSLAYAESVSAVDFLVRRYGRDALVKLIRSYATGLTDDEAFSKAIGLDVAGFQEAWLRELGAAAPKRYGPQPAPSGPAPSDWTANTGAAGTTPSNAPAVPAPSAATEPPAGAPVARTDDSSDLIAIVVAAVALVVVVAGFALRRRGAGGSPPMLPPAGPPA